MNVISHHTLAQLHTLYRTQKDGRLARRIQGVYLAKMGRTCPEIMAVTGTARRTVQQWVAKYNRGGLDELFDKPRPGQPTKLPRNREAEFLRRLEQGPTPADGVRVLNGPAIRRILEREFGQTYSLGGVIDLLHRLGYSYLCPRPRHEQADPAAQEEFKKNFPAVLERIQTEHPGQVLEVWFQDEARFGQQGTLTRVWARKGTRPRAVRQTRYEWLYVLGAACPRTGQSVGLRSPTLDTDVINVFFEQFIAEVDPNVHVVMVWDQAGFHTGGKLKVPANVTLVPLPPYSPELNPMENLWHYFRSHFWANRTFGDYNALGNAAVEAWQTAALDPKIIRSVCRTPYAERIN